MLRMVLGLTRLIYGVYAAVESLSPLGPDVGHLLLVETAPRDHSVVGSETLCRGGVHVVRVQPILETVETYDGNGRVERDVSESQKGAGCDGSDAGEDVVELGVNSIALLKFQKTFQ